MALTRTFFALCLPILVVKKAFATGEDDSKLAKATYKNFNFSAVTLLLNEDGMIGSNNPDGGAFGVLFRIDSKATKEAFINDDRDIDKFIAVVDQSFITSDKSFFTDINNGKLSGVLIYNNTTRPAFFSPGNQVPNLKEGLEISKDASQNPRGGGYCVNNNNKPKSCTEPGPTGIHWIDIGVPMFMYTNDENIDGILPESVGGWEQQNACKWPCYGMSLSFLMSASVNTPTCIRRAQCDPLGGRSILGSLRPYNHYGPNEPVIIVAAALDALALFHDDSLGAVASATGLVTSLAVAKLIGEQVSIEERTKTSKNIMFTLFQGEQFGFIGSGAINHGIKTGNFPSSGTSNNGNKLAMEFGHIKNYIEIGSLDSNSPNNFWFNATEGEIATKLTDFGYSGTDEILASSSLRGLFLDASAATTAEKIVVGDQHMSQFYQSRFDDYNNLGGLDTISTTLCKVVEDVSKATLSAAGYTEDITTACNEVYVHELLNLLLVNQSLVMTSGWSLPKQGIPTTRPNAPDPATDTNPSTGIPYPEGPMNRYVSTASLAASNFKTIEALAFYELASSLSDKSSTLVKKGSDCPKSWPDDLEMNGWVFLSKYFNDTHSECLNTTASSFIARSPAFSVDSDSAWVYSYMPRYSSWTESVWGSTGNAAKSFFVADPAEENTFLAVGLVYLVVVFASGRYLNQHVYQALKADGAGVAHTSNAMYAGPAPTSAAMYGS